MSQEPSIPTTGLVPVEAQKIVQIQNNPPARTIFSMQPKEMVLFATEVANVLKDVIDKQKLYSEINRKKYVKVEGWCTLGTILGVLPVEDWVKEHPDGSFEAMVKLVRQSDGMVVGAASALCGSDERTWGQRDRFARRSMAITRATGKAYRLGLSWIMSLAGYEGTPAEEMPAASVVVDHGYHQAAPQPVQQMPELYLGHDHQKRAIKTALVNEGINDPTEWGEFAKLFHGLAMSSLAAAVKEFKDGKNAKQA